MQKICGRGSTGLWSLWRLPRNVEACRGVALETVGEITVMWRSGWRVL